MADVITTPRERHKPPAPPRTGRVAGLLAEFDSPEALKDAARKVREAGYTRWDAHAPYPVHGIDAAVGIRQTRLPWVVMGFGTLGCVTGLWLQWWTNATSYAQYPGVSTFLQGYDLIVSGKPFWSLPANIPIIFELTVLFAAAAATFGMLLANNLPLFSQPVFHCRRFMRVTTDGYYITIDASDPRFRAAPTADFLLAMHPVAVEQLEEPHTPAATPPVARRTFLFLSLLALIPLGLIAVARNSKSATPRIHPNQDMDNQVKYKAQQALPRFADGRAMRPPVGATPEQPLGLTVARGELYEDEHFYRGIVNGAFVTSFPTHRLEVPLNPALLRRGQERFNIYCAPCHGRDGSGNGIVNLRAVELSGTLGGAWVQAIDLTDDERRGRSHGHLFNSITNGIRTMPPYGDQIPPADRWAIVAYVRALQRSANATPADLPPEVQKEVQAR